MYLDSSDFDAEDIIPKLTFIFFQALAALSVQPITNFDKMTPGQVTKFQLYH